MTKDTERALDIIRPLADVIGITELNADDRFLYVNHQAIGISGNSTYATVMEFIGYCIIRYSAKFRDLDLNSEQLDDIKRYWFNREQLEKMGVNK